MLVPTRANLPIYSAKWALSRNLMFIYIFFTLYNSTLGQVKFKFKPLSYGEYRYFWQAIWSAIIACYLHRQTRLRHQIKSKQITEMMASIAMRFCCACLIVVHSYLFCLAFGTCMHLTIPIKLIAQILLHNSIACHFRATFFLYFNTVIKCAMKQCLLRGTIESDKELQSPHKKLVQLANPQSLMKSWSNVPMLIVAINAFLVDAL